MSAPSEIDVSFSVLLDSGSVYAANGPVVAVRWFLYHSLLVNTYGERLAALSELVPNGVGFSQILILLMY